MTHHTPRSRKEIEKAVNFRAEPYKVGNLTSHQATEHAILEVLLDQRDLLQEIRDVLRKQGSPPTEEDLDRIRIENTITEMERDPLFDEAVEFINKYGVSGMLLTTKRLQEHFEIHYARSSALIDQLEAAGVITEKDKDGRRHVV